MSRSVTSEYLTAALDAPGANRLDAGRGQRKQHEVTVQGRVVPDALKRGRASLKALSDRFCRHAAGGDQELAVEAQDLRQRLLVGAGHYLESTSFRHRGIIIRV